MQYKQVVDGFLWTGDETQTDDPVWIAEAMERGHATVVEIHGSIALEMETYVPGFEFVVTVWAYPGDYVVRDAMGNMFPYKPNVFRALFEEVAADGADDADGERRQPDALPNEVLSRQVVNASSLVDTDGADEKQESVSMWAIGAWEQFCGEVESIMAPVARKLIEMGYGEEVDTDGADDTEREGV